ncbi:MAG: transketolase [Anaerolineae bacterium]|nr:transketolase [Anaerolineae bacterium]
MPPTSAPPNPIKPSIAWMEHQAIQYRKAILEMIWQAQAGHIGGSLSCIDLLTVLYHHTMEITPGNFAQNERDHYIHSKGHAVEALYAVLQGLGFFSREALDTSQRKHSAFLGHPTRVVAGIEHNTGALGHGLPVAVGMALAAAIDRSPHRIFTLMGDGELAEGSIWEAAACAAHYQLDRLVAIVDCNGLQISGPTSQVLSMEPLAQKWAAFGFAVREINGHDIAALAALFDSLPFEPGKPNLVIAHTTKGKGVSFIEDRAEWHHHVPSEAEYHQAMREFAAAESEWEARYANI